MIGRVLTEDLNQRLPGRLVFSAAGSLTVDADMSVSIDVQRLDADSGGAVTLLAQLAVERGHGGEIGENVRLTAQAAGVGTQALVAAMSLLLGRLADRVAALVA
jgi:uncharacterized lipoprotein YmbA